MKYRVHCAESDCQQEYTQSGVKPDCCWQCGSTWIAVRPIEYYDWRLTCMARDAGSLGKFEEKVGFIEGEDLRFSSDAIAAWKKCNPQYDFGHGWGATLISKRS